MQTTNQNPVIHSTFSIERTYPSQPAQVFAAFSNPVTKRRWFAEAEGWVVTQFDLDFRVGGSEISRFHLQGGPPMGNDTIYLDIVPEQRIVFAYTMTVGAQRISVSLATVEIEPASKGTRLVYTEQGIYFDGAGKPASREEGSRELLEKLGEELQKQQ